MEIAELLYLLCGLGSICAGLTEAQHIFVVQCPMDDSSYMQTSTKVLNMKYRWVKTQGTPSADYIAEDEGFPLPRGGDCIRGP